MSSWSARLSRVRTGTWVRWAIVLGTVAVVFLSTMLFGPDHAEVRRELEDQYGVDAVEWKDQARFSPEVLVVDGRDLSDQCTVRGEWASLENLRIECDGRPFGEGADREGHAP